MNGKCIARISHFFYLIEHSVIFHVFESQISSHVSVENSVYGILKNFNKNKDF